MADLVTRLLLNSSNFDDNLRKSTQQVQNLQTTGMKLNKGFSAVGSTITKFAGYLGIAYTAGEAFNKTIRSSQTLSDTFDSSMQALTTSVDQFFYALGSGEFQTFLNGLSGIIDKAQEAYSAMDQLGNTRISFDYTSAQNARNIQEGQAAAKNKFAPVEARNEGFAQWQKAIQTQIEQNETLKFDLQKAVTTAVEAEIGKENIRVTMEDVDKVLKIDVTNPQKREQLKNQYSTQYDEYKEKVGNLGRYTYKDAAGNTNISFWKHYTDGEKKIMEDLAQEYREAIIVNAMLNKYKDEELTALKDNAKQFVSLDAATYGLIREFNETANEYNNANKAVEGFQKIESFEGYTAYTPTATTTKKPLKTDVVLAEGSLAKIEKEISEKNNQIKLVTSDEDRARIQKEIQQLTQQKEEIELRLKFPADSIAYLDNRLSKLKAEYNLAIDSASRNKVLDELNELTKKKRLIEFEAKVVQTTTDIKKSIAKTETPQTNSKWNFLNPDYDSDAEQLEQVVEKYQRLKTIRDGISEQDIADALQLKTDGAQELIGLVKQLDSQLQSLENTTENLNDKLQLKDAQKQMQRLEKEINAGTYNAVKTTVGGVRDLVSAFTQFENFKDMSTAEQFFTITDAIFTTIDSITCIIGAWETLNKLLTTFGIIEQGVTAASITNATTEAAVVTAAETEKATAVTAGQTAQTVATVTGSVTRATALKAEMAAGSTAAYAYIPFAGVGLAAAQIATMSAMIAAASAIPAFAEGGIFAGNQTIGDLNLARVNAGEMILNNRQQRNLFNLLNENGASGGTASSKVEFKIKGNELVGVLNNYNKRISKV